jgi:hypothetical protein
MILPSKHISVQHSILGAGSKILTILTNPTTVTSLWNSVKVIPGLEFYWRFILTLDFLFAIKAIDMKDGLIVKRKND